MAARARRPSRVRWVPGADWSRGVNESYAVAGRSCPVSSRQRGKIIRHGRNPEHRYFSPKTGTSAAPPVCFPCISAHHGVGHGLTGCQPRAYFPLPALPGVLPRRHFNIQRLSWQSPTTRWLRAEEGEGTGIGEVVHLDGRGDGEHTALHSIRYSRGMPALVSLLSRAGERCSPSPVACTPPSRAGPGDLYSDRHPAGRTSRCGRSRSSNVRLNANTGALADRVFPYLRKSIKPNSRTMMANRF